MDAPIAAPLDPVPLDDSGRLDADVECRSCGYNLRGVDVQGQCPECMTAVGRSVHGDLLRFSDPAWVERVARGAQWFVAAILGGLLGAATVAGILAASFAIASRVTTPAIVGVICVIGVMTAVRLYAYWLVTTPDPGRDESAQPFTPRAIARYMLLAATFASVAHNFSGMARMMFSGGAVPATPAVATAVSVIIASVTSVTSLVGIGAFLMYGRNLATRLPDDRLARHTRIVMWGYLVSGTIVAIVAFVRRVIAIGGGGSPTIDITHNVTMVPAAVFAIWGLVLVFWFRRRLRAAAAAARETWASHGPTGPS